MQKSFPLGVAEWKYEFTFFDIIEEPFFAPLRLCANLIHTWIQQRLPLLNRSRDVRQDRVRFGILFHLKSLIPQPD